LFGYKKFKIEGQDELKELKDKIKSDSPADWFMMTT
jgi:hypothetical protein